MQGYALSREHVSHSLVTRRPLSLSEVSQSSQDVGNQASGLWFPFIYSTFLYPQNLDATVLTLATIQGEIFSPVDIAPVISHRLARCVLQPGQRVVE